MRDFGAWLSQVGLGKHAETFRDNDIDFDVVGTLDEGELKELGLSLGDRKRLRQALEGLKAGPSETEPKAEPATVHGADRRQLTVLFSDMVGSTALSRELDPEDLRDVMRVYHEAVGAAVREAGGFVAKMMGDGLMAYFGYPQASEDAAERAVRAGLNGIAAVKALGAVHGQTLSTRAGIATGPVVVGDVIGEDVAREVNVVGETPNLAARLQGLAAPGTLLIAETTRRLIGNLFDLTPMAERSITGFAEPVRSFEVIGERRGVSRFEASRNAQRSRFVGRSQEVGLLLDRWDQAKGGDGQLVLVSGEAGIGKSRIMETMYQRIADDTHYRIRYQCSPQHANSPLYPATEQLLIAAGIEASDDAPTRVGKVNAAMRTASLDHALLIASLLGAPLPPGSTLGDLTPLRRRQMMLDAFAARLDGLCAERPVLWLIEDAHWIDPTTEELISRVVERSARARLLIVVTHRPEYRPPWSSDPITTQLALNRLSRTLVTSLLDSIGGGKTVPTEVIDHIAARTDGVPLYVEEMFQALRDAGVLRETAAGFEIARPLEGATVPATLQDSLMARLDRLLPAKAVAQLGAAIGREFGYDLLSAVSNVRAEVLREGIEQLLSAGLLFSRGAAPDVTYTFKHALVQDAAYGSLLKDRRADIHRRIARTLSEQQDARAELIAHHLESAGDFAQAIVWFDRAGERADHASATREAITFWRRALRLADGMPPSTDRERQRILLHQKIGLGLMQIEGFGSASSFEALNAALDLATRLDDVELFASTCVAVTVALASRQEFPEIERLLNRIPEARLTAATATAKSRVWRTRGIVNFHTGELLRARHDFENALSTMDDTVPSGDAIGGGDVRVTSRTYLGWTLLHLGFQDSAEEHCLDAVRIARDLDHPFSTAWALVAHGRAAFYAGRYQEALGLVTEAADICERYGFTSRLGHALTYKGAISILTGGEQSESLAVIDRGIGLWRQGSGLFALGGFMMDAAAAIVASGQLHLARPYIEEGGRLIEVGRERIQHAEVPRLQGLLAAADGDRVTADAKLREAIDIAERRGTQRFKLRACRDLACLLAEDGRVAEARALLAPVYLWFTEGLDSPDLREAKALLDALDA